jgi:hypothetical protein
MAGGDVALASTDTMTGGAQPNTQAKMGSIFMPSTSSSGGAYPEGMKRKVQRPFSVAGLARIASDKRSIPVKNAGLKRV